MNDHTNHTKNARNAALQPAALRHLADLDAYRIADGDPDVRGWKVRTFDGRDLGEVAGLLVDTGVMKVRYVEVKLDGRLTGGDDRHVLVPVGATRLADTEDVVVVSSSCDDVRAAPAYERGTLSHDDERALLVRYGVQEFENARLYERAIFDDRHFLGRRRHTHDRPYVTPVAHHLPDLQSARAGDGAESRRP